MRKINVPSWPWDTIKKSANADDGMGLLFTVAGLVAVGYLVWLYLTA